jgi:hypothetical protein
MLAADRFLQSTSTGEQTMRSLLLPTVALLAAGLVHAQMSGNYTIDPAGSGNRNFQTFAAATAALAQNGVSGPVVLSVASGTFTESWSISPITGTSTTNTVTFRSATPGFLKLTKLRASGGDMITINAGVNHVIFDGLTFDTVSGAAVMNALFQSSPTRLTVDDIEIENCNFESGVVSHASYGAIRTQSTNRWNIHHNVFNVSGTALYTQGALEMVVAYNSFNNNNYPYCLSLWNSNRSRCRIFNNLFTGKVTTECIRAWPSHYQIDFWHNTFVIETSGWVVNNRACCTVAWNTYYNNIFVVTGTGGAIYNNGGVMIETDNNLFFVASKKIGRNNTTDYTTLASWSAGIAGVAQNGANDSNSIAADPKFVSATDFHLQPTSPALGKGKPKPTSFFPGHEVRDDFDGWMRGAKKDIGAYELTGWMAYGQGCPGTGNKTPMISFSGNIGPGDTTGIDLANALASSRVALTLGVSKTSIPLGGSCLLLNQPLVLLFMTSTATGTVSVPVMIPNATPIKGTTFYLQYGVADPGAAGGIAVTEGASVRM